MTDWLEELDHHFWQHGRWADAKVEGRPPRPLLDGLKYALGREFAPDLVYPLDYEDDRVAFLAFAGEDEIVIVRFDPPSTTEVSFFGSLAGGDYRETVNDRWDIRATFSHERLDKADGPLQVTIRPPADENAHDRQSEEIVKRSDEVRRRLRRWAIAPFG